MKKTKAKKLLSIIMALIMTLSSLSMLTVVTFAETTDDGFVYKISNASITITGYTGSKTILTIPGKIDNMNVTAIIGKAFMGTEIEEITIPKTVTQMSSDIDWQYYSCFYGANSLKKVTFENGILTIPENALLNCTTVEEVAIPDTVTVIGNNAFNNCTSLKEIDFSTKLQTVGANAYSNCISLTDISTPSKLQTIGKNAFANCSSVSNVTLNEGLKEIRAQAFYGTEIEEITIPKTVAQMSSDIDWQYYSCCYGANSLKKVTFEDGILTIPENALLNCTTVEEVAIPDTVTVIDNSAFNNCTSLKEIDFSTKLQTVGANAYSNCISLTDISTPSKLQTIGKNAFANCSYVSNVTLNEGLKEIRAQAFYGTAIEEITIPKTVTQMSSDIDWQYYSCFYGANSLKKVIFEDGMVSIPERALYNCVNIEAVEIPDTVTGYNNYAFDGCTALTTVYGYIGSWAEEFASDNELEFIPIGYAYPGFPDVKKGDWYYDVVKYVAKKGYIRGYQNGNFGPNDSLKRQDFVCILARIDGADLKAYENVQSKLTDVKKGDYYAAAVNWAVDKGYISGYQNGKFGVNDSITREQVATILYNYMNKPEVKDANKILAKFPDANKVSSFAKIPVAWAVSNGVISGMGNGTVASTSGATRAQIAAIIQRMDTQGMFDK